MWKKLRIGILLFILFLVAADTYMTKFRAISWDETLWVGIYPINVDNDPIIGKYIAGLSNRNFQQVEQFFEREASELGLPIKQPFTMMLAHPVDEVPPAPPPQGSNMLSIGWWSLQLRLGIKDFTSDSLPSRRRTGSTSPTMMIGCKKDFPSC